MNKIVSVAMAATISMSLFAVNASALLYHQTNETGLMSGEFTPKLTTNPDEFQYFIYSTMSSRDHESYIEEAADTWNSSAYDIDITRTTNYDISICDIGRYTSASVEYAEFADALAFTIVFCGDGPFTDNQQEYTSSSEIPEDYFMAEIKINLTEFPESSLTNSAIDRKLRQTVAHEIGHVLGLGHVTSQNYLMCNSYTTSVPVEATESEKEAVYNLYYIYN